MVIVASFDASLWYAALAAVTLIVGAAYSLWLVKRVIFGEVLNESVAALQDVNTREFLILMTLALMVIALGVWPAPLVEYLQPSAGKNTKSSLSYKGFMICK